jgi:IS30 family transposase
MVADESCRAIARRLGRSPSTVSREITGHGGRTNYRAAVADAAAWRAAQRPKPGRLATHPQLRALVAAKLQLRWSPQQIAGWLRREHRGDPELQVSHETIYTSLFVQSRGELKRELTRYLRTRRALRRPRGSHPYYHGSGKLRDPVHISARPAEVADRAVPGHWEGDLLVGGRNSYVATLVERRSRYVCLVRLAGKETQTVVQALTQHVQRVPAGLMATLTWDRGLELAAHRTFSIATGVQVYFCDPQSPWQRGTNENTNGLLRQYLPKGTDLAGHSQDDLDAIALRLNTRPRKTLGWRKTLGYRTPAATLAETVASNRLNRQH